MVNKKYLLILILPLLLLACSKEAKDKVTLQEVFNEVQDSPDIAVVKCDSLLTEDGKQACYGMYMQVKANNKEPIDPSICDKLTDPEVQEGCQLYVQLQKR